MIPAPALDLLLAASADIANAAGFERIPTTHKGIILSALLSYLIQDQDLHRCPGCGVLTSPMPKDGKYVASFCTLECMNRSAEVVARRRSTCKKRYGVEEANLDPSIAARRDNAVRQVQRTQHEEILQAKRATSLQHWGLEHHMKHPAFRAETSRRNRVLGTAALGLAAYQDRTGYANPSHDPAVIEKILATKVARYGTTSSAPHIKSNKGVTHQNKSKVYRTTFAQGDHKSRVLNKRRVEASFRGKTFLVDSKLEAALVAHLEDDPSITKIVPVDNLPTVRVGISNNYYPDLGVVKNGVQCLVEVKSVYTLRADGPRVIRKCLAATSLAKDNGGAFVLAVHNREVGWTFLKNPTRASLVKYIASLF